MTSIKQLVTGFDNEICESKYDEKGEVLGLTIDSRAVKAGWAFIAIKGLEADGHHFIEKAIANGATLIICEDLTFVKNESVAFIQFKDTRSIASLLASNFYEAPSDDVKVIGVTGTNGKTSVVSMLYDMFTNLGFKVAKLSTIENLIGDEKLEATHTTPGPIALQRLLKMAVDANCSYCFMEVSSHAIHQHRIAGIVFAGGLFTNISHDHLDYHKTFMEYLNAKKKFFDILPKSSFVLSNIDDKNGRVMMQNTLAKKSTFGVRSPADFKAKILEHTFEGMELSINDISVWVSLVGQFNAYNILSVFAIATKLGVNNEEALMACSTLRPPKGRFDVIIINNRIGIVDYAHTPDALLNVLQTVLEIKTEQQRVITIVGCGGDRDKKKRPLMAKIATQWSQKVILTSDNPRTEDPNTILKNMEEGVDEKSVHKVLSIVDRDQAIKTAVMLSNKNDIILLAGKGHESYQVIGKTKHVFDDKIQLSKALNQIQE